MNWQCFTPIFEYEKDHGNLDSAWIGHRYFGYDLVRNTKPKTIVELGTHKGGSFFSFCQAVKDAGLSTKLYAIDTWQGDKHAGKYDESVFDLVKNLSKELYSELNISLIKKSFNQALEKFSNNTIDILHIDGLHTYEAVKEDFDNWMPKVKENGIILLHDVFEKTDDFGVYKLWNELKKKYKYLEFENSHGLGILFKGDKSINFKQIYQNYYSLLMENNIQSKILDSNNIQISKLNKNIRKQEQMISKYQKDISKQEQLISELDTIIKKVRSAKFFKLWQFINKIKTKLKL